MKHGSEWYKREPTAYLGGVQGMSAKEHAVFGVVLDLIYQHGGSVNDDPAWFAGWISDMGSSAVRKAVESLIERKKLIRVGDQLTNKRANSEAKTKENLRETRAKSGEKGGIESGKSRSVFNKNNDLSEAIGSPREEKRREDKEEPKGSSKKPDQDLLPAVSEKPEPKASPRGSRLPDDWHLPKDWGDWAVSEGWAPDAIRSEADKFRDYWIGKAGAAAKKVDWQATWRNWMRNSNTPKLEAINGNGYLGSNTGQRRPSSGNVHQGQADGFALAIARRQVGG